MLLLDTVGLQIRPNSAEINLQSSIIFHPFWGGKGFRLQNNYKIAIWDFKK